MSRSRFHRLLSPLLAVVLHAVAMGGLYVAPLRHLGHPSDSATAPAPPVLDEIDITTIPSPEESTKTPAAVEEVEPAQAHRAMAIKPSSPKTPSEPSSSPPPVSIVEGGPTGSSPIIVATPPPLADLGIGFNKNPFLPKSEAAVNDAERKRAVDHAMKDPAREKERALGLGPEGPVLTALAESTSRSLAPVRGRAVFVATTNADGEVVTIELHDAEGSRAGWADAGQLALAALKGKKLRMPPNSTRAVMRIEVVSAWKLPSGQDPGTDITLFHIPVAKGEGKDSAKMSILDPIPKFRVDYLEIGPGVKVPVVSVSIDLFSTNTDPTNVGAKASRIVHTHVIDTRAM